MAYQMNIAVAEHDPHQFSQEAVAAVYARYLFNYKPDRLSPREIEQYRRAEHPGKRIKHQHISRALQGNPLSEETLDELIEAFEIKQSDAHCLRKIWHGEEQAPIVEGELTPPPGWQPNQHETALLLEEHRLGPDGLPNWQETRQTIRARVDRISHFPYRFDTEKLDVTLLRGGYQGLMTQYNATYWEVPFNFPNPIELGKTHSFAYRLDFHYDQPPPREYRRVIYEHLENFDLHVFFDPRRTPSKVWWTEWELAVDGPVKYEEPVTLDDDLAVHRHLVYVERAALGFRWDW